MDTVLGTCTTKALAINSIIQTVTGVHYVMNTMGILYDGIFISGCSDYVYFIFTLKFQAKITKEGIYEVKFIPKGKPI